MAAALRKAWISFFAHSYKRRITFHLICSSRPNCPPLVARATPRIAPPSLAPLLVIEASARRSAHSEEYAY